MMRAGYDVGDNFSVLRIRNAWLQNAHHGGWARIDERIESDFLADHGGIALERGGPKTIRQYHRPGRIRTVVLRIEQPAEHRAQTHHLEVRSPHHPGLNRARFTQPQHGEPNRGEITE